MCDFSQEAGPKLPVVAIFGRKQYTGNYEEALRELHVPYITTLALGELSQCRRLILPGGGDITPAFFGQKNAGSENIDTELDILQFQALEQAIRLNMPVLGICKGMQLINVYFGGTICQHMENAAMHCYQNGDQYHGTTLLPDNPLYDCYGPSLRVNSAHHQSLDRLGKNIRLLQYADEDLCPEGICHESLPILGVQWHPERLFFDGQTLLRFFASLSD